MYKNRYKGLHGSIKFNIEIPLDSDLKMLEQINKTTKKIKQGIIEEFDNNYLYSLSCCDGVYRIDFNWSAEGQNG